MINDYQLLYILLVKWAGLELSAGEAKMLEMHPERCQELETRYRWDDRK